MRLHPPSVPVACVVPSSNERRGVATVEFAIVAPILFVVVLAMVELGRGMMALDLLANAARAGARAAVIPGGSTASAQTAANNALAGIAGATTVVKVNGATADPSTASTGDQITVTVSVPMDNITWVPGGSFLSGRTLTQTVVMRKE